MAIKTWSTTAADNINSTTGVNFDEGMAPSAVNNSSRELMAQTAAMVADVYTGLGPYYVDTGAADVYVLTADPAITAYAVGQEFNFKTANVNTGATTINVNSVGAKAIKVRGNALVGAELTAGKIHKIAYNGTDFDLLSPADAYTDFLRYDGTTAATGDIAMGTNKITGLADGAAATDAASYGQVILKDGTNAATGDIAMGTNKITGLAAATLVADAPTASQVQNGIFHGAVGVGTNTIATTMAPVPAAYAAYQQFTVKPAATNTGAVTLNVNSLGAKAVQYRGEALQGGEILSAIPFTVVYDGTQFQIVTAIIDSLDPDNTLRGSGAGSAITSGVDNTFYGVNAGATVATGSQNVIIGDGADGTNTGSGSNVIVGEGASGLDACVAVGKDSYSASAGTAVGRAASAGGEGIAIGSNSTAVAKTISIASSTNTLYLDATSRTNSTYLPIKINGVQYYISLEQ